MFIAIRRAEKKPIPIGMTANDMRELWNQEGGTFFNVTILALDGDNYSWQPITERLDDYFSNEKNKKKNK